LPILRVLIQRLVELGHRRIVMLARSERLKPEPGGFERAFLGELEDHGITTWRYNLPDWDNTRESFHRCLDSLFEATPPTALIVQEAQFLAPTQQHLARRGILAPDHVSLVCADPDPSFAWSDPPIAHIRWDSRPVVRYIVRWAAKVSRGRSDRRKSFFKAEFIEGGTVGRAPAAEWRNPQIPKEAGVKAWHSLSPALPPGRHKSDNQIFYLIITPKSLISDSYAPTS
jgi:DNA-binding LacI/PurR family transcriptional regulator